MSEELEEIGIIEKLLQTMKKVGKKKVINALSELYDTKITNYDDSIISFIKEKVCESYKIDPSGLNKSYLVDDFYISRNMIIVLIKKHLNINHVTVSKIFGKKGHTLVSNALSDFKNKNERIKEHRIYLEIYNQINLEVEEFKKKIQ